MYTDNPMFKAQFLKLEANRFSKERFELARNKQRSEWRFSKGKVGLAHLQWHQHQKKDLLSMLTLIRCLRLTMLI